MHKCHMKHSHFILRPRYPCNQEYQRGSSLRFQPQMDNHLFFKLRKCWFTKFYKFQVYNTVIQNFSSLYGFGPQKGGGVLTDCLPPFSFWATRDQPNILSVLQSSTWQIYARNHLLDLPGSLVVRTPGLQRSLWQNEFSFLFLEFLRPDPEKYTETNDTLICEVLGLQ